MPLYDDETIAAVPQSSCIGIKVYEQLNSVAQPSFPEQGKVSSSSPVIGMNSWVTVSC